MKKVFTASLSLVLALFAHSHAAEKSDHKLSDWKLGKVLFGEKVAKDDMKGKVVVIEHWGVKCPPCIALLPHLAKLDKRHREDGLLIIGAESQGHSEDQIEPLLKKNKIDYTITSGANGPINFSGIPHAFVFDVEGKLIFNGSPGDDDFERAIKNALKDVAKEKNEAVAEEKNLFETQTWTNDQGIEMKAAVKSASAESVTFLMPGGKVVEYPMTKLSEASQKRITEAVTAQEKSKEP